MFYHICIEALLNKAAKMKALKNDELIKSWHIYLLEVRPFPLQQKKETTTVLNHRCFFSA